jgi:hypothetical protein
MKCDFQAPRIVERDGATLAQELDRDRRGYTPEWNASDDAGVALNRIFARYLEIQGDGLNAMPQRLQLQFLESLGANVLAPQPARAPLVFKLLATASGDATVPMGTRVAAVLPQPAPSLDSGAAPARVVAPEYFTEQEITAMRGTLAAVYSIDPQADTYADHTTSATSGFAVFDNQQPVPHRLYLGHGELFKLTGTAEIVLSFDFAPPRSLDASRSRRPLLLDWEYLSVDGWQPLILVEDLTERFTLDGRITLAKRYGPDSKEDLVAGHSSCWIRATVSNRTPGTRIGLEPAGYLVRFTPAAAPPVAKGDAVKIQGSEATANILDIANGRFILDAPLSAAPGSILQTDAGTVLGTILAAPAEFRLSVESTRDLLAGDVVTIDGATSATIIAMDDTSLSLSAPLTSAQPGMIVELANALPPLRPDGADEEGALPQVDLIRARVGFGQTDLTVDDAYLDSAKLDTSKDFHPFGEQPARFATFYVACKDAFTRAGAHIELQLEFTQVGRADFGAQVIAEFYNGSRWVPLGPKDDYVDGSESMTRTPAQIVFTAPANWADAEVNGERARWLRLRLAQGSYGQPISLSVTTDPTDPSKLVVSSTPDTLQPPVIGRIAVNYLYFTNPQELAFCVTENDFAFAEHSEDARWPRSAFAPFTPVADLSPAVHFGFTSKPPAALVSVLVQILSPAAEGDPQPYIWDYWGSRGWTELSVRDTTVGLQVTGVVQFVGAPDALPREGVGGALYRIRARLKSGLASQDQIVGIGGVWLNAAWARQGQRIERDGLGVSNGLPDQAFALPIVRAAQASTASDAVAATDASDFERLLDVPLSGVPIIGDELVEICEWRGRGDDWQTVLAGVDAADIRFETDPQDPTIKTAAWVRWWAQPNFYRSGSADRHYVVERSRGVFRFPGLAGRIPPAGAPIVVSYVTGGGVNGNVAAGAIRELRSGVGFVQSVTNPIAASGGAEAELLRGARDRNTHLPRHRHRAVSAEDYEWIAMSASSEVARARALPLAGPDGAGERGFVGIVLVPHSIDPMPQPSPELCRTVLRALANCVPAGVASGVRIVEPQFVAVSVRAEILPRSADEAGRVEARVRRRLQQFLHPLTGGARGLGWDFGESVYLSDLAALIETTSGVDAVRSLQLLVGQSLYRDQIPIEPHQLITSGDSQLKLIVPQVTHAVA